VPARLAARMRGDDPTDIFSDMILPVGGARSSRDRVTERRTC
jgi:hypothetical protein